MADYMLVLVLQKILSLSGQNILLLCYYAEQKKDYGQPTRHFHILIVVFGFFFFSRFVYSVQAVFGEFQAPHISWNMNYSVLNRLCFKYS